MRRRRDAAAGSSAVCPAGLGWWQLKPQCAVGGLPRAGSALSGNACDGFLAEIEGSVGGIFVGCGRAELGAAPGTPTQTLWLKGWSLQPLSCWMSGTPAALVQAARCIAGAPHSAAGQSGSALHSAALAGSTVWGTAAWYWGSSSSTVALWGRVPILVAQRVVGRGLRPASGMLGYSPGEWHLATKLQGEEVVGGALVSRGISSAFFHACGWQAGGFLSLRWGL